MENKGSIELPSLDFFVKLFEQTPHHSSGNQYSTNVTLVSYDRAYTCRENISTHTKYLYIVFKNAGVVVRFFLGGVITLQ